ncbi:SDR family NAD(P)-dependent oxidoreductase [Granulicella sp. L46]|uniref:SDR family NAD(P)-dependent oxidoreductase n=1 Tax=Granulicella sp. L46 TaxID=1641865 RepID=UPI00131EA835|nr:SDR family oxidoreductase [Granulicella sp. L46]
MARSLFDLTGHVAAVLGGTTGIGRAMALGLAEAGADVVASARRAEQVEDVAREIEARGVQTLRMTCDVSDRESIQALCDSVIERFRKVDILINCAGMIKRARTLDFPETTWNQIIDTNLTGTLRGCQIFGKSMLDRGYGRIINIGSLTTFRGFFEVAAYGASKAAVGSLTKSLAVEWSKNGVTVNAIAPGVFRTEINAELLDNTGRGREFLARTPMGRFGNVDELVSTAIFLAAPASSFITGQIVAVDGGFLASGVNQ